MNDTVQTLRPLATDRLAFTPDGHANPDALVACIIDADARTGSSGLAYIAEHTDAGVLNEQARIARALDNADAYLAEYGATPGQAAVMTKLDRILSESGNPAGAARQAKKQPITRVLVEAATLSPGSVVLFKQYGGTLRAAYDPRFVTRDKAEMALTLAHGVEILDLIESTYVVPTEYDEAARITAAGARGAILNAYLWRPDDHEPDAPTLLSVNAEPNADADLDLAGARDLRAQLVEFLPKLDAMIDALAVAEQDGAQR